MDVLPADSSYNGFKVLANYILNPGNMALSQRLPFLSNIYQTYRFKKLKLRWRSLSNPTVFSDGSYGVGELMAAVNLNAADPPYTSEDDMRLSSNFISHKCTQQKTLDLLRGSKVVPHPSGAWRFINVAYNSTATGNTLESDLGQLQLAVNGLPTSQTVIGEWWLDYTVEFSEQKAPDFGGSTCLCWGSATSTAVPSDLNLNPLPNCTLPVRISGTTYASPDGAYVQIGKKGTYMVSMHIENGGNAATTASQFGDYVKYSPGGGFLISTTGVTWETSITSFDGATGRANTLMMIEVTRDATLTDENLTLNSFKFTIQNPPTKITIYISQLPGNLPNLSSTGFLSNILSAEHKLTFDHLEQKLSEVNRALEKFKNLTLSITELKNDDGEDSPVKVVSTTPVDKFYKQKNSDEVRLKKEAKGFFSNLPLMASHS